MLENSGAADASAVVNPQAWVQSWARLASAVSANALSAPRVVLSPLGNPDALGVKRALPLLLFAGAGPLYSADSTIDARPLSA